MAERNNFKELSEFFRSARHLWGRCPCCGELFRLSEVVISFGSAPPRDWLQKLRQERDEVARKKDELNTWQAEIEEQDYDLRGREDELNGRSKHLEREAEERANQILKSDYKIKQLVKEQRRDAVQRSRSTLLGKLFERLSPFLQGKHDPRDIRAIMDPIDYVCFDGLTEKRRVESITFAEVKAGTSEPSATQRSIMKAVREGRVTTEVWQFGERGLRIPQQLMLTGASRKALPKTSNKR